MLPREPRTQLETTAFQGATVSHWQSSRRDCAKERFPLLQLGFGSQRHRHRVEVHIGAKLTKLLPSGYLTSQEDMLPSTKSAKILSSHLNEIIKWDLLQKGIRTLVSKL